MDTLISLLKGVAPLLATAVAGPAGAVIISKLASSLGVSDTVAAVAEAIATDPLAADKLRELDLEYAKLDNENFSSARLLQVAALQQEDVFSKHFVYYLATFWSVCAASYVAFITFATIPDNNVRFADTILGFILGTVIASIMNFFFGSSKSSRDKTEMLIKGGK